MIFFICLFLEIPQNVHRCCTRCYDKLSDFVRKKHMTMQSIEKDDDDNNESTKISSIITDVNGKQRIIYKVLIYIYSL